MSIPEFLRQKISSALYDEYIRPPVPAHHLTFSTTNWTKALDRAGRQMSYIDKTFGYFKTSSILTEKDLPGSWFDTVKSVGLAYGYGYWSWKPLIICNLLDRIDQGEFLVYLDGGCKFPDTNAGLIDALSSVSACMTKMIDIGVDVALPTYQSIWFNTPRCAVSLDILRFFGLERDLNFIDHFPHWEAGAMLIRKTERSVRLMRTWRDTMLDNLPVLFANRDVGLTGFVHNSGDQSVLQCLLYKNKTPVINANSVFYCRGIYARDRG